MTDVFTFVSENWANISTLVLAVIGLAATVAAATPTPKDDGIVLVLRKIVDVIGMNVGSAESINNAKVVPAKGAQVKK